MKSLMTVCVMLMVGVATSAVAQQKAPPPEKGARIYQTDQYGRVQHNQPSWVVKDGGRVVEVSPHGQEQHHTPAIQVKGDRVVPTDRYGNVQHRQPSWTVETNGRIVATDPYGNKQYHKPGFEVRGSEVYRTDRYGNRGNQTHEVKDRASSPAPANGASKPKSSGK